MSSLKSEQEEARLKALSRYEILDTPHEEPFDDITRLAAHLCGTPVALVTVVGENRLWFKSTVGWDLREIPLEGSFCSHAINKTDGILVVTDALADERFANSPLVVSKPFIRFYAGVPLTSSEGYALGTLCVMDFLPRELSSEQSAALRMLARQVVSQLELRRSITEREEVIDEKKKAEDTLQQREEEYRVFYDDNPTLYFTVDKHGTVLSVNGFGAKQLGYSVEELVGGSVLDIFYEGDKHLALNQLNMCLDRPGEVFQWELRKVHKSGSIIWVRESARAVEGIQGDPIVLIVCEDITERKNLEETLREKTAQVVEYQRVLLELAKMDNSDLDLTIKKITSADSETLNVERVGVWLFNRKGSEIVCQDLYTSKDDSHENGFILKSKDYPGYFRALEESRTLAANDARSDPRTKEFTEGYLKPYGITSMMDIPIRLHGRVVGVLCHEHKGPKRDWTVEEQDFAASVADMVSLAFEASERKKAEEELRRARDELELRVIERTAELMKANDALRSEIHERKKAEYELRVLNTVNQAMNESLEHKDIYRIALDKVIEQEYFDLACIYMVDEARNEAVIQDHRNFPKSFIQKVGRIPYPLGVTWKVINTGKILNVRDAESDPDLGPAGRDVGFRSMLGIPISLEKKNIGVLWLLSFRERVFTKDLEELLTSICSQIAVAVARADLYRELSKKNRYESVVSTITRSIHQSIDLPKVLENTVEAMSRNLERADKVAIYMVEGEEAVLKSHRGFDDSYIRSAGRIPYPKGFTWNTIIEGKPRYCEDAEKDSLVGPAGKDAGIKSYLSMPIRIKGKTVGCINIDSESKNAFKRDERELLEIVAQQIEIAIYNAKKAEALRESEQRYRTLFDQSPVGVYIYDQNYIITECNERMAEILGSSRDRITGLDMNSLRNQNFMTTMKRALEGETYQQEGYYEATTSSAKLWLSACVAPLRDADGHVTCGMCVVEDITERKHYEETLLNIAKGVSSATAEAFFQSLVQYLARALEADYAFIGELVDDKTRRVRTIAVCADGKIAGNFEYDLTLTPCENVVSRGICSYVSGVREKFPQDYLLAEMGVEGYVGTPLFDTSDRVLGLVAVLYRQPVKNIKVAESMLQIFAIRAQAELERRGAEKALRDSEAQLRLALRAARMGTWDWDIKLDRVNCSEEAEHLFGLLQGSFSGNYSNYEELIYPEDRRVVKQAVARAIEKKEEYHVEHRLVWPDGSMHWLEFRGNVFWDENHRAKRMAGTVLDITERKRMENEVLRSQKLESLGLLAGGIAHDFNNLLTAILGNISLAKLYGNPDEKTDRRLSEAEKASIRARDLTLQLLTFSRGGAPIKKVASLGQLVTESTMFAQRGSNVRCELSIAENLWQAEVDEGQISQVINNLVINAIQAMPRGGVIKISAENVVGQFRSLARYHGVDDVLERDKKYVRVIIEDQGIGIPEEHISRIFDPYFTTKQKGSGLGLSVTYSIIRNHDGYIAVESRLGEFTKFYVYLPANEKEIPEGVISERNRTLDGKGRVLVMDDEDLVTGLLEEMLSQIGYEVGCARDGNEAIELYREAKNRNEPFEVVIMDLTVPGGMGGVEVINKLAQLDPGVKAIVSSGYSNDPVMSQYRKYGFVGVVTKPYKIEELSRVLYEAMNGKR